MNEKFNIKHLIILAIILICFYAYYKFDTHKSKRIWEVYAKEFPEMTFECGLNGLVTQIVKLDPDRFREHPHSALIVLDDTLKIRIRVSYELGNRRAILQSGTARPLVLNEVLSVGDRIVKKSNSYTISICKNINGDSTIFYFELTDDLGYTRTNRK